MRRHTPLIFADTCQAELAKGDMDVTRVRSWRSGGAVSLLDINNSVPKPIYDEGIAEKFDYQLTDTFMGFHCGKTLFEAFKYLGIADIAYNQPRGLPYPTENPVTPKSVRRSKHSPERACH